MRTRGAVSIGIWIVIAAAAFIVGALVYAYATAPAKPAPGPGPGPVPPPVAGGDCAGPGDACPKGYECIQKCGPPVAREGDPAPGWYCAEIGKPRMCPICLASDAMIDAPGGPVNVKDVRKGTVVWSIDASGEKVAAAVLEVARTQAPPSHRVVRLIMDDGREARVSPNHPMIDGRYAGDLRAGDTYENGTVRSAELEPYGDEYTYDLLPEGIGVYWVNGILMGSTLTSRR